MDLFNQIVNQINRVGLSEITPDVHKGTDNISIEAFMVFVTETLGIDIPVAFQDPAAFTKFVQHRIMNFKSHTIGLD